MRAFEIHEQDLRPGWRTLRIAGELDLARSAQFEAALERAGDQSHLLVDLAECEFIDIRVLGLLVRKHQELEERGAQLLLRGTHGQIERLLSVTGAIEDELVIVQRQLTAGGDPPQ